MPLEFVIVFSKIAGHKVDIQNQIDVCVYTSNGKLEIKNLNLYGNTKDLENKKMKKLTKKNSIGRFYYRISKLPLHFKASSLFFF